MDEFLDWTQKEDVCSEPEEDDLLRLVRLAATFNLLTQYFDV